MKYIIIKLSDEEYREIERRAREEGFTLISEYIRSVIFSKHKSESIGDLSQISSKLERKIQDLLNPYTSEIQELKRKIGEVLERIEGIESIIKEGKRTESQQRQEKQDSKTTQKTKKTAMEILEQEGIMLESEIRVKNPDMLFEKLERQGAKVIETDSGRIAIHPKFWEEFSRKLSNIKSSDVEEVSSKLDEKSAKLFRIFVTKGLAYFDGNSKTWKFLVD